MNLLYKLIFQIVKAEMPPLPPYPDDESNGDEDGIYRDEDGESQP